MSRLLQYLVAFLVYLFLQVFLFNKFSVLGAAMPHVFLLFLLMLPLNLGFRESILIGFFAGLAIDLLSENLLTGTHAFACVLMMSLRTIWVETITTRIAFKGNEEVFLKGQPFLWYIGYLLPLIMVHHISYYMLEAFGFEHFGFTLLKIFASSIFTFIFCLALTLLFYTKSKGRSRR